MKMSSLKRGKKPKKSRRIRKARRGYSPSPPTSPRIELPYESRSPSPVALRNRKRRSGSESPNDFDPKRPSDPLDGFEFDFEDQFEPIEARHLYDRQRVVPSNYLKFNKEVKHFHISGLSIDVSSRDNFNVNVLRYPVIQSFVNMPRNVGANGRDGDSITVLRIAVKMWFETLYSYASPGGVLIPPPTGMSAWDTQQNLRVCIIRDAITNGVLGPNVPDTELWDHNNWTGHYDMSFRNPAYTSRFEMLYDQVHTLKYDPPVTYVEGTSPGATAAVGWYPRRRSDPVEIFIERPIVVKYSDTVSTPMFNNIFMICYPGPSALHLARYQEAYIGEICTRTSFVEN